MGRSIDSCGLLIETAFNTDDVWKVPSFVSHKIRSHARVEDLRIDRQGCKVEASVTLNCVFP